MQALLTAEGLADDAEAGEIFFALGTLAMGDLNATTYAQCGHVQILREAGAMPTESMLTYRGVPPAGKVYEGVIIDDHVVAAAVPRRWPRRLRQQLWQRSESCGLVVVGKISDVF